jgi:hypothetical protein
VALLATLLFRLLYDFKPEMVNANKKKLEEMGLLPKPIGARQAFDGSTSNGKAFLSEMGVN